MSARGLKLPVSTSKGRAKKDTTQSDQHPSSPNESTPYAASKDSREQNYGQKGGLSLFKIGVLWTDSCKCVATVNVLQFLGFDHSGWPWVCFVTQTTSQPQNVLKLSCTLLRPLARKYTEYTVNASSHPNDILVGFRISLDDSLISQGSIGDKPAHVANICRINFCPALSSNVESASCTFLLTYRASFWSYKMVSRT